MAHVTPVTSEGADVAPTIPPRRSGFQRRGGKHQERDMTIYTSNYISRNYDIDVKVEGDPPLVTIRVVEKGNKTISTISMCENEARQIAEAIIAAL